MGLVGADVAYPVDTGNGAIADAMLLAAGLWVAGDAVYDFRQLIWDGLRDAGEWTWDGLRKAGESIADVPGEVLHGLEHRVDPLDW